MSNTIFTDEPVASPQLGPWRYWPLRFVLFSLVLTGVYLGCRLLPVLAKPYLSCLPSDVRSILFAMLGIAILIALYRQLVRWTEKRAAAELSATGVIPSLLGGAAIGCVLFCAVIAVLVAYGAASFKGIGGYDAVIKAAAASLIAAVGEEIAFRGGVYRLLEEGFGSLLAIAFTGALFALLHAPNPGATAASTLAIMLESGILLAAAYVLTRSLWFPIGLHFGWNFTEGGIFGASVSGGKSHGLLASSFAGPDWLVGGKFGPEASVPAVIICLITSVLLLVLAMRRREWKPLRFRFAMG
jgi:hypothetical protein